MRARSPTILLVLTVAMAAAVQVEPAPARSLSAAPIPVPSLRLLADRAGVELGALVSTPRNLTPPYGEILTREFNLLMMGGGLLNWAVPPRPLRPARDRYDFGAADEVVAFAARERMKVQAHHLAWGWRRVLPDWLVQETFDRVELRAILEEHIRTVVGRYRGRIDEWSVVNETITRRLQPDRWGEDFWLRTLGPDYIAQAFRWARAADPGARLILGDFANETSNAVSEAFLRLAADLKRQGVPLDGIGMQMHLTGARPPRKADVVRTMRRFGELGLEIYVTEFDVDLSQVGGTREQRWAVQAAVYRDMLEACLDSGVCRSFTIFGISDRETWYLLLGRRDAEPLPFDAEYRPKPAYFALRDVLLNRR